MNILRSVLRAPVEFFGDAVLAMVAEQLLQRGNIKSERIAQKNTGKQFNIVHADIIEQGATHEMEEGHKTAIPTTEGQQKTEYLVHLIDI